MAKIAIARCKSQIFRA